MEQVSSLSFDDAIKRYRTWHQDQIVDFLQLADVGCDIDAVRKALAWKDLTEPELDSDLGNLPRLLKEIGLGEEWETYVTEAENYQPEDEYQDEPVEPLDTTQFLKEAERIIGKIEALPVENGPVELSMDHFSNVQVFAEACQIENEIKTLLTVQLPVPFEQSDFDKHGLRVASRQTDPYAAASAIVQHFAPKRVHV